MKPFNVEGFYYKAKSSSGTVDKGKNRSSLEFFHKVIWAIDAKNALEEATRLLNGGCWKEIPKINDVTEERKMRKLNAPELPGMEKVTKKRH